MKKRYTYIEIIIITTVFMLFHKETEAQESQKNWNIKDYYDLLKQEHDTIRNYKYGLCVWYDETDCEKIIDINNGYIATDFTTFNIPYFQMTMFKDYKSENLIVIHAANCGDYFACAELEELNSFLIYDSGIWVDVSEKVLPQITLEHFFTDKKDVYTLKKLNYHIFRFYLPRLGTTMKVTIEICDYIAYDDMEENAISYEEYERLLKERKTRYLK